jgi:hypothetical protein
VTTASPCAKIVRFNSPSRRLFSSSFEIQKISVNGRKKILVFTLSNFEITRRTFVFATVQVSIFWVVVATSQSKKDI